MNFKPLGKRVLVKKLEEATTTISGIIIPDNAKEKPSRGEIVAISSEINEVSVGELVVFAKFSGNEISLDGDKFLVLDIEDVLGVIK